MVLRYNAQVMSLFSRIFTSEEGGKIEGADSLVADVNALEGRFEALSSEELSLQTANFKKRIEEGESLEQILPEAFAAVREASKRTLKQRHYDVQLVGGLALHQGKIAEMKTGEGKTLAATLAVYANAISGKGVHVVTVNDYLSRRDTAWMGQIYNALGMSVACLNNQAAYMYDSSHTSAASDETRDEEGSFRVVYEFLRPCTRKEAYSADITYGTNNEFGFDYLRDNLAQDLDGVVQRVGHGSWHYAIVDEVDSILIDEARTPLIISRPDTESAELYQTFARLVPKLQKGDMVENVAEENADYTVDEKSRSVLLTEKGIARVEEMLKIPNLYEGGDVRMVHHLEQALKAHALFHKDQEYVAKDGEIIIVDEFTGRLMPGRRYSEGLHQAIEAKEGVPVQRESRTVATITFQNYFRKYEKLAGMTGTALSSREELFQVYGTDTVSVPTHKPTQRVDESDSVFRTVEGKYMAVVREVKEAHKNGQPVLLGTVSIEKNEYLSTLLNKEGVPHTVLNAKNHDKDAEIIAQAGAKGTVTVATNIAGRGVDIMLGGHPYDTVRADEVRELGGLYVIGTERHEARRIDNQLRGRSGRQGDPGRSRFFVSLEDDLMRIFGGEKVKNIMARLNIPEDEAIESSLVSKAIESAQSRIEGHHFDSRKHVLQYDEVINKQREAIYETRRKLIDPLNKDYAREILLNMLQETAGESAAAFVSETGVVESAELARDISRILHLSDERKNEIVVEIDKLSAHEVQDYVSKLVLEEHSRKEGEIGEGQMRDLERAILLRVIDELWMDHLDHMDYMKRSIGLRAVGQRDPLIEYKNEARDAYRAMQAQLKAQVSELLFHVRVIKKEEAAPLIYSGPQKQATSAPQAKEQKGKEQTGRKIGRNEVVVISDGTKTQELKYKKAEKLLEDGWKIVEVKS